MQALSRWLAAAPARLAGLSELKGAIAPGCDADLVIWDPDAVATVDAATLYNRHAVTPYHGLQLRGAVRTTMLRGEVVFEDGVCIPTPLGRLIRLDRRNDGSRGAE